VSFARKAAIVGIGQTEFSKDSGRTELRMATEAAQAALADAGLAPTDVDGLTTFSMDNNEETDVAGNLGTSPLRFFSQIGYGGGAACATVQQAAMAVANGVADVVIAYRSLNGRSWQRLGGGGAAGWSGPRANVVRYSWYIPFGLTTPAGWMAIRARRYMHKSGATSEDFGRVSVLDRKHGARNPSALFYDRPITLEDHQASPWIVEPLRKFDCCLETDGAVAVVVTSVERARDLKQKPAVIAAAAQGATPGQPIVTDYYRDDITILPEVNAVANDLWAQSGLGPDDIQAANLYDHFTPLMLIQLEELGFCGRGEAKDFVRDGNLELDGKLPTNTNGGQLAEAYIHGMNGIAEGVRQIRGTSPNQADNVEHVLVTAGTGVPTSALILEQS
jgi:17-hydroxy-3-oxo-4-pregnene-20-carboxyl-CoA lyase